MSNNHTQPELPLDWPDQQPDTRGRWEQQFRGVPPLTGSGHRRFWSKVRVQPEARCPLTWAGGGDGREGYGRFWHDGRLTSAHRVAAAWAGLDVRGAVVMHSCDNPRCLTPDHLTLGTLGDNNRDRSRKGRTHRHLGEKSGKAVLTTETVHEIRAMREAGVYFIDIARHLGVAKTTVRDVISGRTWSHV